jgi:predicted O-methyltransferase YrrM
MEWLEFFSRFGGAFRKKNVNFPYEPTVRKTQQNKRIHYLRGSTELPEEFIRLDPWEGEFLFMIAARAKRGILEIGRYNGGSALLMACANPLAPIYSIDIKPQNDRLLQDLLKKSDIKGDVRLLVGDSQNVRDPGVGSFDMLFVDGDHSYESVTKDLHNWYGVLDTSGHVILHDCYHGSPVMDAVLDFISEHDVTILRSPFILSAHWTESTGSMMHFIKRDQ